jgi:murein DD-endopeptidase MepM/ murein hydrolase activator NlpD
MNLEFSRLGRLRLQLRERRKGKGRRLLIAVALVLVLLVPVAFFLLLPEPAPPSLPPEEPAQPRAEEPKELKEPDVRVVEGRVEEKGTLFKSLAEKKIPLRWIDLIVSKLSPHVNFKKLRGGAYRFVADVKGDLITFIYEAEPTRVYEVRKESDGYMAQRVEVPVETHLVKVVGEIRSSLFEAMNAAGEEDSLTLSFAEILAWEVDFYKDVKEGDRFKILVEKVFKGHEFIRYGSIQAVEYDGAEKKVKGILYQGEYYNEMETSLRKALLKAPLRFNRISSQFSGARRHPILGGVRPHLGTDYAAPPGTPVWAVGDGTVVSCGYNEGYGNQVVVRHNNGYQTYYSHLSRYGKGMRSGCRVKQKQVIGYVGSTGLSTGPHLDYRLAKNGQFKNPLRERFPAGIPIGKAEREQFQKVRDRMLNWLEGEVPHQHLQSPLPSEKETEGERGEPSIVLQHR